MTRVNDVQYNNAIDIMEAVATGEDAEADVMVKALSGHDCIDFHNFLRQVDRKLKARWEEAGAPDPELLR